MKGRITFTPTADGYDFAADTRFDPFAGIVASRPDAEHGQRKGATFVLPSSG